MIEIRIEETFAEVQRELDRLDDDVRNRAAPRAVNRTMDQGKTAMSREIRGRYNIGTAKVSEALTIKRARFVAGQLMLEAELEARDRRGRSINVINFAAKQTAKGVSLKVVKGGGRKTIPGAFIANGGRTVFIRKSGSTMDSRSRYAGTKHAEAIESVQAIGVAQMFNTRRLNERVVQFLRDKFPEVFEREVRYYTERFNGGAR